MDSSVILDMKRAIASGNVNRALTAYIEARLADVKTSLVVAGDATIKQQQGRALELQELLKTINLAREP